MERKLERCIRLRFVSLCTCVCTSVYDYVWAICLFQWQWKEPIKHRLLKIKDVCLSFNTSLGAFARWKAPSIPRCTTTTTTKREHRRMPRRHDGYCDGRSFHTAKGAFTAFVLCFFWVYVFCWPRGDINFRWDFWFPFPNQKGEAEPC